MIHENSTRKVRGRAYTVATRTQKTPLGKTPLGICIRVGWRPRKQPRVVLARGDSVVQWHLLYIMVLRQSVFFSGLTYPSSPRKMWLIFCKQFNIFKLFRCSKRVPRLSTKAFVCVLYETLVHKQN